MGGRLHEGLSRTFSISAALAISCLLTTGSARADGEIGRVTLMAGAPRMVGESIRPLQAILSGRMLETGEADAAGLLVEDVVFHIGTNSKVTVLDEPEGKRLIVEKGYVVFYTEAGTTTTVIAETPFGRLTSSPDFVQESGSGWYSVRHDPEQPNVSPAVSTFAAMEGPAEVAGTAPEAGPYMLGPGQRWRIVQGRIPGPPEEGDERADADDLRRMLHREAAEMVRAQADDLTRLAAVDLVPVVQDLPADVIAPEGQFIIDGSSANQDLAPGDFQPAVLPLELEAPTVYAIGDPTLIPAGTPELATAHFVSYDGIVADAQWEQYLTNVEGDPAFQPRYLTEFANGGFSYIQLAGPDAELVDNEGEMFLAGEQNVATGWAIFTPQVAAGDAGFDADSRLAAVVTEGLRTIARGEHLSSGGTIGGDGVDPGTAFATVSGGQVQLNEDRPPGYPQLDLTFNTTGLTVGDDAVADQIAALGAGLDPQDLAEAGPQLLFLSSGTTDARDSADANRFNFDGEPIEPTELDLPGDRAVQTDNSGTASLANPLSPDVRNTVGIQFAGTGPTIAVIHHTGLRSAAEEPTTGNGHFEIVRGDTYSIVQWREGQRVTGPDGQALEIEDLNEYPELRTELFTLIGTEVNSLTPPDTYTVYGPAVADPDSELRQQLRRTPGRLARARDVVGGRDMVVRGSHTLIAKHALKSRTLRPAGGRLILEASAPSSRRHVGRVSTRR